LLFAGTATATKGRSVYNHIHQVFSIIFAYPFLPSINRETSSGQSQIFDPATWTPLLYARFHRMTNGEFFISGRSLLITHARHICAVKTVTRGHCRVKADVCFAFASCYCFADSSPRDLLSTKSGGVHLLLLWSSQREREPFLSRSYLPFEIRIRLSSRAGKPPYTESSLRRSGAAEGTRSDTAREDHRRSIVRIDACRIGSNTL